MRRFMVVMVLILINGCTVHTVQLVDMKNGDAVNGTFNISSKRVVVTLPDGEAFNGRYVALTNTTISSNSMFYSGNASAYGSGGYVSAYGSSFGNGYSVTAGGSSNGYALLRGSHGSVMEVIFQYNGMDNHGFGTAKTNKGKEYKVIF